MTDAWARTPSPASATGAASSSRNNRGAPRRDDTEPRMPLSQRDWMTELPSPVRPTTGTSSPPRGLKEAYDRILDEENLAAEESVMGEGMDEDSPGEGLGAGLRNSRQSSTSAMRSRTSLVSVPAAASGAGGTTHREDETRHSGSPSVASGISSVTDASEDSFARNNARHTRDQERIHGALKGDVKLFSKARRRERGNLTAENLRRKNGAGQRAPVSTGSASFEGVGESVPETQSLSSYNSEPPLNLPREWGKKGRKNRDWLSRTTKDESKARDEPRNETDRSATGRNNNTDWVAVASDVPIPSVEDVSSFGRDTPQKLPPAPLSPPSTRRADSSLDAMQDWQVEEDFTARSLQISSSPPLKTRNRTTLDQIREREIEALKGQAVTTNRLGEIKERTSRENLLRTQSSGSELPLKDSPHPRDERRVSDSGSPKKPAAQNASEVRALERPLRGSRRESTPATFEQLGEAIPNTPIVVYKSPPNSSDSTEQRSNHDRQATDSKTTARPQAQRQDSHGLLRRLARAAGTSASPSPPKNDGKPATKGKEVEKDDAASMKESSNQTIQGDRAMGQPPTITRTRSSSPGRDDKEKTPKPRSSRTPKPTPAIMGGWIDTPAPTNVEKTQQPRPTSPPSNFDVDAEISALGLRDFIRGPSASPLYQRSGGIEGRPARGNRPPRPDFQPKSPSTQKSSTVRASSVPTRNRLPKSSSTLPSVVPGHDGNDTDSTADSIEEMIANDVGFGSLLQSSGSEDGNEEKLEGQDLTIVAHEPPTERQRRAEIHNYARMEKRLSKLRLSLHDTKRGIEGLESRLETSNEPNSGRKTLTGKGTRALSQAKMWQCPQCGLGVQPPLACTRWHFGSPLPTLYYWEGRRLRLTWFGVVCVLGWAYVLSELIVCQYHCRVYYTIKPYPFPFGIDPTWVDPPFVTYKYLRKAGAPWLIRPIEALFRSYWKLIRFVVGAVVAVWRDATAATPTPAPSSSWWSWWGSGHGAPAAGAGAGAGHLHDSWVNSAGAGPAAGYDAEEHVWVLGEDDYI
ncbi:MAG: hypothetical protein M4579_005824 [Chaenotheca gracillima]|nr:MAG: hypothetical protein M4579_005824 [Chaenotheca gracillima]